VPIKIVRLIKMCLNETYSKVLIGKYMSHRFPFQNGLEQGDALSPLLLNFALEYAIRKVQENQVGLKLIRTHQLLAYADDMNVLGDNIDTVKKNTETLIDAGKEVGVEINIEESKYMLVTRMQVRNYDTEIANRISLYVRYTERIQNLNSYKEGSEYATHLLRTHNNGRMDNVTGKVDEAREGWIINI
jgi:hypothetical protein